MKWFKRREPRIDTAAIILKAEDSLKNTRDRQENVNILTTWLNNRNGKNGFGEDFEVSIRPKEAR